MLSSSSEYMHARLYMFLDYGRKPDYHKKKISRKGNVNAKREGQDSNPGASFFKVTVLTAATMKPVFQHDLIVMYVVQILDFVPRHNQHIFKLTDPAY